MTKTSIEWATDVWNPVTGCSKVSQGCKHCYAERIANRFWGEREFTDVRVHPERLDEPLKWRKPRRVFVNSMSDLFHESVSDEFIDRVFETMHLAYRHTFMILTKRPDRMSSWINYFYPHYRRAILPNVWLGVSVEDQATADERIPLLLGTPAAVRFVSYEPALMSVDFTQYLYDPEYCCWNCGFVPIDGNNVHEHILDKCPVCDAYWDSNRHLDWIIMGGESGPVARPMHPDWARSVRDQCQAAGVPFFFKQMVVDGKLAKMPALDGIVWNEYPEATK